MIIPRRTHIFVLVDALGWTYIRDREFLSDLLPYRQPLHTVLGFSSGAIPTILTGVSPAKHGHWNLFYFDPERSPFRFTRPLSWLPEKLVNRRVIRKLLKEIGRRLLGLGRGFECVVSPRILSWFNFVETRNIYEPGGISGAPSIFDQLVKNKVEYRSYCYHRYSDQEILKQTARDLKESKCGFFFLYLSELDAFLHDHCQDSAAVSERIAWYGRELRKLYKLAEQVDPEVTFTVFSDHGMTPVHHHFDLVEQVESLGLRMPSDYLRVYDSTMARFWFFNDRARQKVTDCLSQITCGKIISEEVRKAWGVNFPDDRFGEVVFLLDPGWLLAHSDFHGKRWMPVGMHGYHPEDEYSDAAYLGNCPPPSQMCTIADIFQAMEKAASDAGRELRAVVCRSAS